MAGIKTETNWELIPTVMIHEPKNDILIKSERFLCLSVYINQLKNSPVYIGFRQK